MTTLLDWIRRARAAVVRALTPSTAAWSGATRALLVLWVFLFVWIGVFLVFDFFSVEKLLGYDILFGGLALVSLLLALVIWLFGKLKAGYRTALLLALLPLLLFGLAGWAQGTLIVTPIVLISISFFFGALASWRRKRAFSVGTTIWGLLGAIGIGACTYFVLESPADPNPALANYHLRGVTLSLPDPGKPGPFKVSTFTYGSGKDQRRPEFAKAVRFVSRSVDGSKLDTQWSGFPGWVRTRYWGFDAAHMPLQARVWMPEGQGPFPIVLIVHGNHPMEDFSDPGYAYLGALLASQGFVVASVDENFLNSSVADYVNPIETRTGDENKVRAWLLLEHLAQWRDWAVDPANPLHGRVDMTRIVLVGHSRGGESVATANEFNKLAAFPDDATIKFNFGFNIRGIVAIAPIDGQYKPRDWPTPMRDQNYFVIQGSMDGDVVSFAGSSQYSRATFSGNKDAFKASLYVKGANHGQFNTAWGRDDLGLPLPILDTRPIMDPLEQRKDLAVYLSAFLHETLMDQHGYRQLFEDARNGAAWLPDGYLMNNYADSGTRWLATYEEDIDPATGTEADVAISGDKLTVWSEDYPKLKEEPFDTNVAELAWDDRAYRSPASYALRCANGTSVAPTDALVFSASQVDIDTLPKAFKGEGSRKNEDKASLDWSIAVADSNGVVARVPLSADQVLYPQVNGQTRRAGMVSFIPTSEIVMRRFKFPFAEFVAANPKLDLAHVKEIRLVFDRSKRGAIALDDVGIAK
jgi:dienelactone hydrolase